MNSDDYDVKYLHLFIRWKYFCFESSEAWRQEAKLWHFSMIYIYEPEWESKLSKTVWFWLVSPQKARACITAPLCYYNALSAEWSCALCSGTLIRRNVPPAHSQHFRVAVDVEKYIRYIDKSLASELKHFLLPQSSGRSWLKEIFLFSQFSDQLHERHCSSIFTGHIQSIHCMLPARPRCEECAVIATPASAPPPPLHLIRREWRTESGAMRCPDT